MSEDPTEQAQEDIHHHAAHGEHGGHGPRWITAAALTAALLAALAAVAGGQGSGHLTESTHSRIEWSDKWGQYQSKSIKNYVLESQVEVMKAMKAELPAGVEEKIKANEEEKKEISAEANGLGKLSDAHLATHETFEHATMMFHISIAVVAIAVVAKRKEFWMMSMVGGAVGLYFFVAALSHAPVEKGEGGEKAGGGVAEVKNAEGKS